MRWINSIIIIAILALGSWSTLLAQGDLPSGQVDIVKSFEARLAEANRVEVKPVLPALDTSTRRLQYTVVPKDIAVEYLPPKIRPLAFRTEQPPAVYDGYLRLGGGLPSAFYGEFSYDLTKNEAFDLGVDLFRHSANNTNQVENQRFNNTKLGLDGTYYFEQGFAVQGNVGYHNRGIYYYGYNEINDELDTAKYTFEPDQVMQRFSTVDLGLDLFNGQRTVGDFNYRAGVDLYLLNDEYAARENGLLLTIEATKWFAEQHPLSVVLRTDFTAYKDTTKQSLNNFHLEPSYTYHGDMFQVKVGLNLTSNNDKYSIFPDIEASANIIEGVVTAFVGATGNLRKNNLRSLSEYNPFIRTRVRIRNTRFTEYYGGVRGNIIGATYNAQIGYTQADNLALFQLNDPFDSIPRFNVLYDTANIVTIKGSIILPLFEGLELTGSITQNIFSLEREEKPWHLPSTTISAGARYTNPEQQFSLRADLFLENGVPYRT
ncbi:MAG: hypothetical protein KDC54_02800, partial [Lewinella sp.]|nr:hypothetical protein [Lewinella sp.]